MRKTLAVLSVLSASLATGSAQAAPAPLEWLEGPTDPAALAWARDQSAATKKALFARPAFAAVSAQLNDVLHASPPPPNYALVGDKALRFERDAAHPHGLLQVARRQSDGMPGAWTTVLDVDALRASEGKPYELHWGADRARNLCLPPAYDRCILTLSPGGGDEEELREFDIPSGAFVAGGFRTPQSRVQAAWLEPDKLLIATTLSSAPRTAAGWPSSVQLWLRGTPLAEAPVVMRGLSTDALIQLAAVGVGADRAGIVIRAIDFSTFEMKIVDRAGGVVAVDLPQALKPFGLLASTDHHLIVQLAQDATVAGRLVPAETVVAYDVRRQAPDAGRVSVVYSPKDGDVIADPFTGLAATASSVGLVVDHHLSKRMVTATLGTGGWSVHDAVAAPPGASLTLPGADPIGEDMLVGGTGFITPGRIDLLRPGRPPIRLYDEKPAFDASSMMVEIRSARSRDGTMIDYYLVRPKALSKPGETPTLMTGYGAFGMSMSPAYLDYLVGGPAMSLWLTRGGALAVPVIRGGGERGEAWHQAAIREKRQNSYDDFEAVADDLDHGFTVPRRMGVFGSSNGGLLAATVAVQRPDLFGAVVSDVPLADMLRFPLMGMGGAWKGEYGDPNDPAMRQVLLGYSPLQNIKAGKTYPPFFITVSTADNRVGPGHARKLAARLDEVGAKAYYFEDEEGGHDVSDALERPDLMSLRMTFLIDALMR